MQVPLTELLRAGAPLADLAAVLDELGADARRSAIATLTRADQRRLYDLAAGAAPLGPEDFVPAAVPALTSVRHDGYNSLPVPANARRFTKVMARDPGGEIVGWNDSPTAWWLGPGYFVLRPTAPEPTWVPRGAQVVDYYRVPAGGVPAEWPRVRPNWVGLQVFVYFQTRDYMRRVSRHVTIGAAYKWGFKLDQYFVLSRVDG